MNKKNRPKPGVLLFEVAFVVLLISVMSLFLFRGYGTFAKAARKSLDYMKLVLIADAKIWDFELKEDNGEISADMPAEGDLDTELNWQIGLNDTDYPHLKIAHLTINYIGRGGFDTAFYLESADE